MAPAGPLSYSRGLTCEHGGHSHVRSGCLSTRSYRRDHRDCRPAPARDCSLQPQGEAERVSALWSWGVAGQAVSEDTARLRDSRPVVSARSCGHVFPALLYQVSQVFQCGPRRSGTPRQSRHASRDRSGGTDCGRGRLALSSGQRASVARPPGVCALCHDPKLGRGGGKKRPRHAWTPTSSTGL